jgi:hypothetical protein
LGFDASRAFSRCAVRDASYCVQIFDDFIAMPKCELCELADYTQRYADFVHPFRFTILDCDSCDTPMAVLRDHRAVPTEDERAFMIEALSLVARAKYGADKFGIDDVMRQIPDHCHMHARPIRRWQY